jgi:hypothetical protein
MPSIEMMRQLQRALLVEQEKRMKQRGLQPGLGAREQLYSRLDQMRARREALGRPYAPPTAAEKDDLVSYLSERADAAAKS